MPVLPSINLTFKNKSEEERYRKMASKVAQMGVLPKEQLKLIYTTIIKFMKEYLLAEEFRTLNINHINQFIEALKGCPPNAAAAAAAKEEAAVNTINATENTATD